MRTVGLGHPLTQGTADSNEVWVELMAKDGDRVFGRSGGIGDDGRVDPFAHFLNVYMLDRDGHRIDRRNVQDIFVPLYDRQIPPGSAQVVHFGLDLPADVAGPITLDARVNYRKFDRTYQDTIFGPGQGPALPVVVMDSDSVTLPVPAGRVGPDASPRPVAEAWRRWNDYGIGLLLEGGDRGSQKGELKQAEAAFARVAELGRAEGWVNGARVLLKKGRLDDARHMLDRADRTKKRITPWVNTWLRGQINLRDGQLDEAVANFTAVLATSVPGRGFDFGDDDEVLNALASALDLHARQFPIGSEDRRDSLRRTIATYRRTLALDSENVAAHHELGLAFGDPCWNALATDLPRTWNVPRKPKGRTDAELLAWAEWAAVASISPRLRAARVLGLVDPIERFVQLPPRADGSRLETLHAVVERLGPAWDRETDPVARAVLARVLSLVHKELRRRLKPDETAQGQALAIARRNDPAANQNAQSIVVHPLRRPGVPGWDGSAPSRKASEE